MLIDRAELKRALAVRASVRSIPFRDFVNLDWDTMVDCARLTNTQFSYPRITSRIIQTAGWIPIKEGRGDAITRNRQTTQIKVSILSDNKFNFVYTKPSEQIDFYSLFGIYDDNSVKMFMLSQEQMNSEIRALCGKSDDKRMSLNAESKSPDYVRWLCSYAIDCPAFSEKPSKQTSDAIDEAMRDRLLEIKSVPRPCIPSIFDD